MKKCIFIFQILICLLLVSSCSKNEKQVVISKDYSKITYNDKEYELLDCFINKPDDAIEVYSYSSIISYDVIYSSESFPEYIWLETSTDYTENKKFESVLTGNVAVYKTIE